MNTNSEWNQLAVRFRDKKYRDLFVEEQIFSRLPLKIKMLREQEGLTQAKLGEIAGMKQTWISKLEDPNYGKLTISTLLKVASAFDVGLYIDFVPFSEVLDRTLRLSPASFAISTYKDDAGLKPCEDKAGGNLLSAPLPSAAQNNSSVIDIGARDQFRSAQPMPMGIPASHPAQEQGGLLYGTFSSASR